MSWLFSRFLKTDVNLWNSLIFHSNRFFNIFRFLEQFFKTFSSFKLAISIDFSQFFKSQQRGLYKKMFSIFQLKIVGLKAAAKCIGCK